MAAVNPQSGGAEEKMEVDESSVTASALDDSSAADKEEREKLFKEFIKLVKKLDDEWNKGKGKRSLTEVYGLLDQAKLLMAKLDIILPKDHGPSALLQKELTCIKTVLEIGAYYSLELHVPDIEQFVRYTSQLKTYYLDYSEILPESPHKFELCCAKLLWLLTENRISDFHTELALILYPPEQVKAIQYNHPILFKTMKIAESLEDGRYNNIGHKKTFKYGPEGPTKEQELERLGDEAIHTSDICKYFVKNLVISCRPDVAETLEKGYERWSFTFAMKLLHFKNVPDLEAFASKRGWTQHIDDTYTYELQNDIETMPAQLLLTQSLAYAKDLEQII